MGVTVNQKAVDSLNQKVDDRVLGIPVRRQIE